MSTIYTPPPVPMWAQNAKETSTMSLFSSLPLPHCLALACPSVRGVRDLGRAADATR